MTFEFILSEKQGRVGVITLNRPKQMNALNAQVMQELAKALYAFDADEGVGCILITGNDKAFAAGADIAAMKDYSYMDAYKANYITRDWEHIRNIRKPVIAAVAGYALGGGCELTMMCDLAIAATIASSPTSALSFTTQFMPISAPRCTTQPCSTAPWPTVASAPTTVSLPGKPCSMQVSWMLAPSSTTMRPKSPRRQAQGPM